MDKPDHAPLPIKLLLLAPFPPRSDAIHGAGQVMAQFILALSPRYRIALLYLQRPGDAPPDEKIQARCEYIGHASLPLLGGSVFQRWQRLFRLIYSLLFLRPMWVTDLACKAFAKQVRAFAEEWQPDLVQIEMHAMGQYLSSLERCPAPRVLVEYEPGIGAAPFLKSSSATLNRFVHVFDQIAWRRYEKELIQNVQAVIAFTNRDREILEEHGARTPIHVISPGIRISEQPVDPSGGSHPQSLLFTGNFIHPPNIEAALHLAQKIFPLVQQQHPDIKCIIVGDNPPSSLERLEKGSIIVTGRVPEMAPYLNQASLVVTPLYSGSGIRIKVLEALAAGKAIVATSLAIQGLDLIDGVHVALADSDEQFAERINRLLDNPRERVAMASRAHAWACENLGWERAMQAYERLTESLLVPKHIAPVLAKCEAGDESMHPEKRQILPPVSLVICSRNRPQLLLETVQSVLQGNQIPCELVVIDQSDQAHATLSQWKTERGCPIRYIHSATKGLSRARNAGIAAASCEVIAFTDDDMQVAPDWFAELIGALLRAGPRAVVTGRVLPAEAEKKDGFVAVTVTREQPRVYQGRIGTDVLVGAQMAFYRAAIEEVGLFDERLGVGGQFQSAEDNDYGFRLLESGYRIVYAPQAVIYHRAWRDSRDYFLLRWGYGRGKGGFYLKHASMKDPYMLRRMIWDMVFRCIRFPWRFLHRPRLAVGDLVSMLGTISGALEWIRTQKRHESVSSGREPAR